MSEAITEQAVTDQTNAPAAPGAAVTTDARATGDELDTLLAEYELSQPEKSPEPARTEQQAGTVDVSTVLALRQEMSALKRSVTAEKDNADFAKAALEIRGDVDHEIISDGMVREWIRSSHSRADLEKIDQIWSERDHNPAAAKKMIAGLRQRFASKGPGAKLRQLPDRQATEDREAVTHAVRGANTRAPEGQAPDFSRMSNADFAAAKDRMFG